VSSEVLIGVDIGASSIKAGAYALDGKPLALASRPNGPVAQPGGDGWFVWDAVALRGALLDALREVAGRLPRSATPRSLAVAGFGADGAPFSPSGEQRYPIISWHDARARAALRQLVEQVGEYELYAVTGYHPYPINTLARWLWLRDHAPAALDHARWLMMADIAAYWLSGAMRTDPTCASTTMAFDLRRDAWAQDLLELARIPPQLPAPLGEPGEAIGTFERPLAGLPAGTVVAIGGHDCEVGTLAASAGLPPGTQIDITGTWEMVIAATHEFAPTVELFEHGIDWERHAVRGTFLCQSLMPAGSVLTWVRDLAYGAGDGAWTKMIADAERTEPGARGVEVVPAFVPGMGPSARRNAAGALLGLTTTTTRGQIARAAFEALCLQLRAQLEVLERVTGTGSRALRVLGGGQRNDFWLQLKADVTGLPVEAVETEELTLLGAALIGGVGAGAYASVEEAQRTVQHRARVFEPRPDSQRRYEELFFERTAREPARSA
jgi:sugar (pentulose or hexulose) kinase